MGTVPSLPLADAAAHMGVSVDTLRRRIRRGELEAVKDDRGRYRVEAAVSVDTSADYSAEVAVLRERVARLEDELEAAEVAQREMRALVAQAQSVQLRLMGGEVVILSDEMRALVSQAQSLQLPLMGGGSPGSLDLWDATMPATPPPRRRWWQRGSDNRGGGGPSRRRPSTPPREATRRAAHPEKVAAAASPLSRRAPPGDRRRWWRRGGT
jgi:excisionase family DNA binding protein